MPVETPFFFGSTGHRLFGVLHEGIGPAQVPMILCHAFGEEKLWAHRVFVSCARQLAKSGHTVLRFDYHGNGDSEGRFQDCTIESCLENIDSAIEFVRHCTGAQSVGLLGLRFGAALAALAAARRRDIGTLVLWAPVVNGNRYSRELLRINVATQMAVYREIRADREELIAALRAGQTVNVEGYDVSRGMYQELSQLDLMAQAPPSDSRCLIVQIDRTSAQQPGGELEHLGQRYNADLRVVREEPFWTEIDRFYDEASDLVAATQAWLDVRDQGAAR